MDARITKQRLGNLLSYDWLKILLSVVAAVVLLAVFFTMVGTRPSNAQTFAVYVHEELNAQSDFFALGTNLEKEEVFSYDILKTQAESFSGNKYASTVFTARRAAGEGTVYFVPNNEFEINEETGEKIEESNRLVQVSGGAAYNGADGKGGVYDTVYYLADCAKYLDGFYHGDYKKGELNEQAVRECFLARNSKDKRFRTGAKKKAGILQEEARIKKLREDYIAVQAAFESGKLSHITYAVKNAEGEETEYNFGISFSLSKLDHLVGGTSPVALMIFHNKYKDSNLRFETVSFLNYLVEKYGE